MKLCSKQILLLVMCELKLISVNFVSDFDANETLYCVFEINSQKQKNYLLNQKNTILFKRSQLAFLMHEGKQGCDVRSNKTEQVLLSV